MPQPAQGSTSPGSQEVGLPCLICLGIWSSEGCHASLAWGSTSPGVPGARNAYTCPGIRSPGGCHTSACLGICTLTRGHLALRLQQYWVG